MLDATSRLARRRLPSGTVDVAGGLRLADGLRRSPILRRLDGATLEGILTSSSMRSLEVGALVQGQDAGTDRLLIVASGALKAHQTSRPGLDRLLAILGPGDAANTEAVIHRDAPTPAITALRITTLLSVPGEVVRDLIARAPDLGNAVASVLAADIVARRQDESMLADLDTRGRVALRLAQLATDWGARTPDGLVIDLPLTQEELGSWAGVSRESAAKALKALRANGTVSTGRRLLVVHDLDDLEKLAGWATIDLTALASHIA